MLEAEAAYLGLKHLLRNKGTHGKIIVFIMDSSAIGALSKGRSSQYSMLRVCRKWATLALLPGVQCSLRWVRSEDNPADVANRGRRTVSQIVSSGNVATEPPFQPLFQRAASRRECSSKLGASGVLPQKKFAAAFARDGELLWTHRAVRQKRSQDADSWHAEVAASAPTSAQDASIWQVEASGSSIQTPSVLEGGSSEFPAISINDAGCASSVPSAVPTLAETGLGAGVSGRDPRSDRCSFDGLVRRDVLGWRGHQRWPGHSQRSRINMRSGAASQGCSCPMFGRRSEVGES